MVGEESISVIVAVGSTLSREVLVRQLSGSSYIRSLEVASTPMELLQCAMLSRADAVILESERRDEMPGILTHMFDAYPKMLAIVIHGTSGCTVYRQQVEQYRIDDVGVSDVLQVLATADSGYWTGA